MYIASSLQASWEVMQPLVSASGFHTGAAAAAMGVYVGIQQMEYGALAAPHIGAMGAFTATGTPFSVAAGRLSFHYGLKGEPRLPQHVPVATVKPSFES